MNSGASWGARRRVGRLIRQAYSLLKEQRAPPGCPPTLDRRLQSTHQALNTGLNTTRCLFMKVMPVALHRKMASGDAWTKRFWLAKHASKRVLDALMLLSQSKVHPVAGDLFLRGDIQGDRDILGSLCNEEFLPIGVRDDQRQIPQRSSAHQTQQEARFNRALASHRCSCQLANPHAEFSLQRGDCGRLEGSRNPGEQIPDLGGAY